MSIEQISLLSLVISILAFIASAVSIYLQYMVEGAKVELLNADDVQVKIARPHKELPEHIQKAYPHIPDALEGYALVMLVFGNSGDRTGFVNIMDLKVWIKGNPNRLIKASYTKYALIPAYEIVEKEILLRNLQLGEFPLQSLEVEITMEYGGYHPRTGKYLHKETIDKTLQVSIIRGDESPWYIS